MAPPLATARARKTMFWLMLLFSLSFAVLVAYLAFNIITTVLPDLNCSMICRLPELKP